MFDFHDIIILIIYTIIVFVIVLAKSGIIENDFNANKFMQISFGFLVFFLPFISNAKILFLFILLPMLVLSVFISLNISNLGNNELYRYYPILYALSWILLTFIFPEKYWIIAIGAVSMSICSGIASYINKNNDKFIIFKNKTLEGFLAMYIITAIAIFIVLKFFIYCGHPVLMPNIDKILYVAFITSLVDLICPESWESIPVSLSSAILYAYLMGINLI